MVAIPSKGSAFAAWGEHEAMTSSGGSTSRYGESSIPYVKAMTVEVIATYKHCSSDFKYSSSVIPRRVLTKPSEGAANNGHDNEKGDFILYVNDVLGNPGGKKYHIVDLLGSGTFGQVVKCKEEESGQFVAVKVVKNKPAYLKQAMVEIRTLELINKEVDILDEHHLVRALDFFRFRRHLCIVFELLSVNLYELLKQNQFHGLSFNLIRVFGRQLVDALEAMAQAQIIHCDLKPENILLVSLTSPQIKVIDLGSACFESKTVYTYIQSRFYRSPEILLGLPYTSAIDVWSLGCIVSELFLGLPIFPGSSEYDQMYRVVNMLGNPPEHMLRAGKYTHKFFHPPKSQGGEWILKTAEEYALERGCDTPTHKRYFNYRYLPEIILHYTMKRGMSSKEVEIERNRRKCLCDFILGLLRLDASKRWTMPEAKLHPFITGDPWSDEFTPMPDPLRQGSRGRPRANTGDLLGNGRLSHRELAAATMREMREKEEREKQVEQEKKEAQLRLKKEKEDARRRKEEEARRRAAWEVEQKERAETAHRMNRKLSLSDALSDKDEALVAGKAQKKVRMMSGLSAALKASEGGDVPWPGKAWDSPMVEEKKEDALPGSGSGHRWAQYAHSSGGGGCSDFTGWGRGQALSWDHQQGSSPWGVSSGWAFSPPDAGWGGGGGDAWGQPPAAFSGPVPMSGVQSQEDGDEGGGRGISIPGGGRGKKQQQPFPGSPLAMSPAGRGFGYTGRGRLRK